MEAKGGAVWEVLLGNNEKPAVGEFDAGCAKAGKVTVAAGFAGMDVDGVTPNRFDVGFGCVA